MGLVVRGIDCNEGMSNSVLHWWVEIVLTTKCCAICKNMEGVNFKSEVNAIPGANGVMILVTHIYEPLTNL